MNKLYFGNNFEIMRGDEKLAHLRRYLMNNGRWFKLAAVVLILLIWVTFSYQHIRANILEGSLPYTKLT